MAASTGSPLRCSRRSSSCTQRSSIRHSSATSRSTWKQQTRTWRFARSSKLGRCAWWTARSWTGFTRWSGSTARALRFGIDAGRAHHALDDAVTLARVYRELERQRGIRARKAVLVNLLDYLGLALALEQGAGSKEQDILFKLAKFYTLGRYSDALAFYEMERGRTGAATTPP